MSALTIEQTTDVSQETYWPRAGDWHVLHTRSRQEKAVAQALHSQNTECFLPLVQVDRRYRKSRQSVDLPLFPGYVFMKGRREQAFAADRNGRLVQIIEAPDQARLEHELTQIRVALESGADLQPHRTLPVGTPVRVTHGSMMGLLGKVERHQHDCRLILEVDMLGQAVSVELDEQDLEPLFD